MKIKCIFYIFRSFYIFYTDSTHKKANANKNKYDDCVIQNIKQRRTWLEEEINEERNVEYLDQMEFLKTIYIQHQL